MKNTVILHNEVLEVPDDELTINDYGVVVEVGLPNGNRAYVLYPWHKVNKVIQEVVK